MRNLSNLSRLRSISLLVFLQCLCIACQPEEEAQVIPNYTQPFLGAWKIKKNISGYTINIANNPGIPNSIVITNLDDEGFNTIATVDGSTFVISEQKFSNKLIYGSGSIRNDTLTVIFSTKLTHDYPFPSSHTAVGVR